MSRSRKTRRASESELIAELKSLAALNSAKDEFLKRVAHDLRTPLGAILVWLDVLRRSTLDRERMDRAVKVIEESSRKLGHLLNELQDVMEILSGALKLDARPLLLAPLVEAAVSAARQRAETRGIRIELSLEPEAGPFSGDASRLQQVIENLLSNAIKFTPDGGRMSVRLEASDQQARVSVSDSGKGISQEHLPLVFERAPKRRSDGRSLGRELGLGLALAHELVRLHGGTLEASSPGRDKGSTFTVTIPRDSRPGDRGV